MTESSTFINKAAKALKEKKEKEESLNASESLKTKVPFIRGGMNKDAIIKDLWEAYKNYGSESDSKNYNFVKHFLGAEPESETDEDYYKINSAANEAFVSMVNGLYPEHLDEKSFKAFLNKEGMLDKMKSFVSIPFNDALSNVDRFKDRVKDFSPWYKSDGTVDQERVKNTLFKEEIAANKAAQEQAAQQETLEQQNQEDYSPDPSGDTGASLGTGFGSMSAPFEVEPLRQAPVWLTRDQEKSVADFIASRALQEYRK